jgi:hypothetical protein
VPRTRRVRAAPCRVRAAYAPRRAAHAPRTRRAVPRSPQGDQTVDRTGDRSRAVAEVPENVPEVLRDVRPRT